MIYKQKFQFYLKIHKFIKKTKQKKKQSMVLWNWLFWCTSLNEGCYSIRYTRRKLFGIKTRLGHHLSHQKCFDLWRKKSMKACLNLNVKDAIFKGHCMCQQHFFFFFYWLSIHTSITYLCLQLTFIPATVWQRFSIYVKICIVLGIITVKHSSAFTDTPVTLDTVIYIILIPE